MKQKLSTLITLFLCFFTTQLFPEGFIAGTLVKTAHGYVPIEYLETGDTVICYDHDHNVTVSSITNIEVSRSSSPITIYTASTSITADSNQLFFVLPHIWLPAEQLQKTDRLLSCNSGPINMYSAYRTRHVVTTYALSIKEYHTYFVSQDDVLVHNNLVGVAIGAAEIIIPAAVKAAAEVCVATGVFGAVLWSFFTEPSHERKDDHNQSNQPPPNNACPCGHKCGPGCYCQCFCGCGQQRNISQHQNNPLNEVNQTSNAIFKNGYYEVNGFRFTEYYYTRMWTSGRGAPSLIAKSILENATKVTADNRYPNCFKYETFDWEMIYDPITKIVHHLKPL